MQNLNSKLKKAWRQASRELGIEVEIPYTLNLKSGAKIEVDVLVKDFGNHNGMLISTLDLSDSFRDLGDEIVSAGYGYSCLSSSYQNYDRNLFIEALTDWGWSKSACQCPSWYIEAHP